MLWTAALDVGSATLAPSRHFCGSLCTATPLQSLTLDWIWLHSQTLCDWICRHQAHSLVTLQCRWTDHGFSSGETTAPLNHFKRLQHLSVWVCDVEDDDGDKTTDDAALARDCLGTLYNAAEHLSSLSTLMIRMNEHVSDEQVESVAAEAEDVLDAIPTLQYVDLEYSQVDKVQRHFYEERVTRRCASVIK
jgi:hypothetical protein